VISDSDLGQLFCSRHGQWSDSVNLIPKVCTPACVVSRVKIAICMPY